MGEGRGGGRRKEGKMSGEGNKEGIREEEKRKGEGGGERKSLNFIMSALS